LKIKALTMQNEPQIEIRPERPYVGIAAAVSMQEEAEAIARHLRALRQWPDSHQLHAAGAPFVRYRRIEMPHRLEIEVGLPLASATTGDADVIADSLPAGQFEVADQPGLRLIVFTPRDDGSGRITPATTLPSFWILTATTSKPSIMGTRRERPRPSASRSSQGTAERRIVCAPG